MANYIDKNELLNAIDKRNGRLPLWLDEILMQDCKVADVAPVKHGHWIYDKDAECVYCSSCLQFNANEYTNKFSIRSKFCSRCGARMDEEEQGFDT